MEKILPSRRNVRNSSLFSSPTSFTSPSPVLQEYFDHLMSTRPCRGITVKQNVPLGKGVYADVDFKEDQLVLKDQMLVGIQLSSNKMDCQVCSFCFRFIGSTELQIGRKVYLQSLGVSSATASSSSDGNVPLPEGVVESLMNGDLVLPFSNKFPLPSLVSCSGGCGEAYYCSKSCTETDWELFHSWLCTGERFQSLSREALIKFIQHANGKAPIVWDTPCYAAH